MHDVCKARGVTATAGLGEGMGGQNPSAPRRNKETSYERCRVASTPHPGVGLGERSEGPRILRPHSFQSQERSFATFPLLGRGVGPRRRGPNRCGAAAALGGRRAGERGRRLEA